MPLSADEKLAIQELSNEHMRYLDLGNVDSWISCWIPEGQFITSYGTFAGRESIEGFVIGHIAAGNEDGVRHLMTNYIVEGASDHATSTCLVVKLQTEKAPYIIATGTYNDVVVKTSEGWKFVSRRLDIDNGANIATAAER